MTAPATTLSGAGPHRAQSMAFGMWLFLTTETLFFGVLFFAYLVMRMAHPAGFAAASRHTDMLMGTLNTAVLLASSVTMALAVEAATLGRARLASRLLAATLVLGLLFLAVKGGEYRREYLEHLWPGTGFRFEGDHAAGAQTFFWLYFVMTGFHALHLAIGVALVAFMAWRLARNAATAPSAAAIDNAGLYWHFVDIVWIFMYPALYLVSRS
ncbi:MAG TPA: cytochrome c oxidase subunit 3 [Casimicrobiaceae bacterium]|nr:cytochrome c oxidase subunit 3 [Casimicrobiaceae bacterium]